MIDHANGSAYNFLVGASQIRSFFFVEIPAGYRELQPGLCFSGLGFNIIQFADEGRLIPPLSPSFCKIGAN